MKKNTAGQSIGVQMVTASDGSAFTGSVTVYVTGDAGTQAIGSVGSGICTHEGNGYHTYAPAQAETNYTLIAFTFIGTGAVPCTLQVYTDVDANVLTVAGTAQTANDNGADINAILVDTADMQPRVAAIEVDTSTTLQAELDAIQAAVITNAAGVDIAADIIAIKAETANILTDTGTTLDTHLTDIKGATFSGATDSLEAIRDRGDTAWTTGAGGTPPQLLQNTTIATLASQVSFTLTAGSADDNAYVNAAIIITDSATSTQKAVALVSAYTGATKTITLSADPAIFTMAVGDTVDILANIGSAPTVTQIRTEMDSNSTQLAAIVADTNELQADWADGGRLDLIQDIIAADTTTDIPALIATAQADLDTLTGTDGATLATAQGNYAPSKAGDSMALTAAAVDAVWDENLSAHQTALSAGRAMTLGGVPIAETTATGTPSTTSIQIVAGSAVDNYYNDQTFKILSGSGIGQARIITSYTGATKTCTFDEAFITAPVATDKVAIEINHVHPASQISAKVMADLDANGSTVIDELTTQGDTNETKLDTLTTNVATVDTVVDGIQADLSNATDGLGAIKTDTAAILVDTGTTLPALIDDLAVKKNATFSNFEFLMVLTSDHVTPATGLTVTGQRSIDGAAFASVSGTIAEVSNGIYQFDALAADTNGDFITWRFSSATADDQFFSFKTVA